MRMLRFKIFRSAKYSYNLSSRRCASIDMNASGQPEA